jgi:Domain of unknown function (DUF4124)
MRMASRLVPLFLGVLILVAAARSASAQTYVWTDERGVVHAAAEPSEVPEKYRAKAVKDAQRPRSNVTVLPPPDPAAPEADPADPTAAAPMKPGHKPEFAPAPKPKPETPPEEAKAPEPEETPAKKPGLPDPAPGFEWSCTANPEGGKPKCEQFEKRASKRARHAAARAEARKQLGVDPDSANDPELQEELQRRADKEYEKTTKKPEAKEPGGDDEESEDSED